MNTLVASKMACTPLDDFEASQAMIDINAQHLEGLRTQCELTAELTRMEIRGIESKLVKLFGKQWIARQKVLKQSTANVPCMHTILWLKIVGLSNISSSKLADQLHNDFEKLVQMNGPQLKRLCLDLQFDDEEIRRLTAACKNFCTFLECLEVDTRIASDLDLHWDSWDKKALDAKMELTATLELEARLHTTPSPREYGRRFGSKESLPYSRSASPSLSARNVDTNRKFPSTPPPNRKLQAVSHAVPTVDVNSLTKSRSHEEKLTNRVDFQHLNSNMTRRRLATEPGLMVTSPCSPVRSPPDSSDNCFEDSSSVSYSLPPSSYVTTPVNFPQPRSPRAHGGMMHMIHHRFTNTMKITSIPCDLCEKPMIFGFKCRECKYRCHRECEPKVPPSCGLPSELVSIFRETLINRGQSDPLGPHPTPTNTNSPTTKDLNTYPTCSIEALQGPSQYTPHMLRKARICKDGKPSIQLPFSSNLDSSSTSSCNSSSASSPMPNGNSPLVNVTSTSQSNTFTFPDPCSPPKNTQTQQMPFEASCGDTKEPANGPQTSEDLEHRVWPRQNSLSLREWDIPFDELKLEKEIGKGRFGTVFKGNWHGSVAVKMFSVPFNSLDGGSRALQAFKLEVATFRKTRHENLVLFMGACMKPPKLAIVTSFCKGHTLHSHIHERKERFPLSRLVAIALQVCQGMGYLHARGILHKDLKSSNIFYDTSNHKVIITDFGLFSLTKLCSANNKMNQLQIPKGWLCYLAPELIRSLRTGSGYEQDDLPFSVYTDVYAFGTIWHEMCTGHLPFKGQPAEVIIWQVGKGIKQALRNLQASKEIKDILMICWAYRAPERPDFSKLVDTLQNLPKKRLQRSPSHPTHLLRSLESLF